MNAATLACLSGILIFCAGHALAAPAGGVFIPRNGGYEGRIRSAHVFIDDTAGGAIDVVRGEWPDLERLARLEMSFAVRKQGVPAPVEVRQGFDRSPEIIFLEEGNDRIGVRVKCKLYDRDHLYHGHAITETWMYPNGETYVTAAAAFEDALAHVAVTDARIVVGLAAGYATASPGGGSPQEIHLPSLQGPRVFPFGDEALPGRHVLFSGKDTPLLGVYWRTGKKEHFTFISRKEGNAPTYYRWPDYLIQAYPGGSRVQALEVGPRSLEFRWLAGEQSAGPKSAFSALIRVVTPPDRETLEQLVAVEREPVELEVEGGVIHGNLGGYNDWDGSYEVRKISNPMTVTLPADPTGRTVRIKAIALRGHGGIVAKLNGQAVVPQLVAEGGIADDPLAPIRELPEGPADTALVTVKLGDEPQTLSFSEEPGVQFAYQTRDRWRNLACFTTRGGGRWSGFRFSLVDGRARNMRGYGRREWALTENLLTWFPFCGFTPVEMVDQMADFEILKNGPDEAVFRYVSTNANGRVRSEYIVRVPADSPAMQMNVTATFTVTERWPYDNCQFFDVFPFRGVWPQDWWYDEALWLAADGRTKTMRTVERTYGGDTELSTITGGGFFALYSSGRGNMVMLTKDFEPALPTNYAICANYIDWHMEVKFRGEDGTDKPPDKGFQIRVRYDLAIWGDENTTRDELIELGKKSIKAGRLVLPER